MQRLDAGKKRTSAGLRDGVERLLHNFRGFSLLTRNVRGTSWLMRRSIKQQLYLFILLIFSFQLQHFKVNTRFRQFMDALMQPFFFPREQTFLHKQERLAPLAAASAAVTPLIS